jgi:hypothetical protein
MGTKTIITGIDEDMRLGLNMEVEDILHLFTKAPPVRMTLDPSTPNATLV